MCGKSISSINLCFFLTNFCVGIKRDSSLNDIDLRELVCSVEDVGGVVEGGECEAPVCGGPDEGIYEVGGGSVHVREEQDVRRDHCRRSCFIFKFVI